MELTALFTDGAEVAVAELALASTVSGLRLEIGDTPTVHVDASDRSMVLGEIAVLGAAAALGLRAFMRRRRRRRAAASYPRA